MFPQLHIVFLTYLYLALSHDLVNNLIILPIQFGFVVTLLVTQDAQTLRTLQFDLKLLLKE